MMDSNYSQLRHQISTPSFTFNPNNKFRKDYPPRPFASAVPMNSTELPLQTESSGVGVWSSPTTQNGRPSRPATIHEATFSYCVPETFTSLPAWDSSTVPLPSMNDGIPQTFTVHQEFFPSTAGEQNWNPKPWEDGLDLQTADSDMNIGQAYTTDEAVPILDLRYSASGVDGDRLNLDHLYSSRRMSGSSFTMSTTGAFSDMQSFEDFSTTLSEAPSFTSDYPHRSNRNSLMSSTQLSPVASPRMTPQNRSELVRTQSRGRASPSPRPSMRSAPYTIESTRSKRWSTGSYAPLPSRRPSPFVFHQAPESFTSHPPRTSSRHSSPTRQNTQLPLNLGNLQAQQHPFLLSSNTSFHRNSVLLPSHSFNDHQFENQPRPLSHGLFRMLQSNADPQALHTHYTDLSDPPDLYASLHDEQVQPPSEDMNPSDSDLVPHEQELRFDGDLYTPRWVRGHGNKREGWCGICKPGRWLVLKNSAFWYDKSFTHGISAATGSPFQEPQETRRMDGNPDVWEGLCGSCNEWVALVSSKKKGTTWFRHAYKCHTHPKIKDAPKRRRESAHSRAPAVPSTMVKPKMETPMTPPMPASGTVSKATTPGVVPLPKPMNPLEGLSGMI